MAANGDRIGHCYVVHALKCLLLCGPLSFFDVEAATTRYEYDPLGRVRSATFGDGSQVTYGYDLAGNRTEVVTKADALPPEPPGPLRFSGLTQSSVTVAWDAASDNRAVARYEYRLGSGAFLSVGNFTTLELQGLAAWTSYSIEVRAVDTSGNPGETRAGAFRTPDTQAPSAPGVPTLRSLGMLSATLDWAPASDNVGIERYEYSLNSGSYIPIGASPTLTLGSLSAFTDYTVDVRARDPAMNSGAASRIAFRTLDTSNPSAPGVPTFSGVTLTSASVSWGAASDNVGIERYEYQVGSGPWTSTGATQGASLSGLSAATFYTVNVRAFDRAGNPSAVSSASVRTLLPTVTLTSRTVSTAVMGMSTAAFQLRVSGDIDTSQATSTALIDVGDWISPKVAMHVFEASTSASACTSTGWHDFSTGLSRVYSIIQPGGGGSRACSFLLSIRDKVTQQVLGTATIQLIATSTR